MALQYPDVMNDLTDARSRFESGSVQYLAEFVSGPVPAGDVAQLVLTLQNTTDAPTAVRIDLSPPRPRGKLRRLAQAPFEIMETVIRLTLDDGEVGQLTVPIRVHTQVPPGEYTFSVRMESEAKSGGARVRLSREQNQIQGLKIRYPQGLAITQIASWGYEATPKQVQQVDLKVVDSTGESEETSIAPQFATAWKPDYWSLIAEAGREVRDRRARILPELTADKIFASMFKESSLWFAESGIQLHVGEALLVAKMLTYTVALCLGDAAGQECLLTPIFAYALAEGHSTGDVLWLVTQLGYTHILEMAIAVSFTLVEETVGRRIWDAAEQRGARDFIVEKLDKGAPLPVEFFYLPLVLGGLVVANKMVMDGEDVGQTVGLLREARAERADRFASSEWHDLDNLLNLLMAKQAGV